MIKDSNIANEELETTNTEETETSKEDSKKKSSKKKEPKANKEVIELKELLAGKIDELAEANDKYLRVLAEYDNFKKRTQKEKEAIYIDSVGDTVTALLPVVDNFERAISAFSEEDKQSDFFKGVEMIYNQMLDSFSKLGVEPINAVGEEFNPELHNAIMHIEDDTIADNTVVEEFQKGYMYKEKVIRYSMVKVAN